MPTHLTVRPATVDDARAIAEVHVASWQAAYRGLLPQEYLDGISVEQRAARRRESLANGHGTTLVAVDSGTVVGFAVTGRSRDEDADDSVGELYALYLRPDVWGVGAGAQLHDAALRSLAGFGSNTLWVLDTNARARRFYERHGWQPDGVTKLDDRMGVDLSEVRYRHTPQIRPSGADEVGP